MWISILLVLGLSKISETNRFINIEDNSLLIDYLYSELKQNKEYSTIKIFAWENDYQNFVLIDNLVKTHQEMDTAFVIKVITSQGIKYLLEFNRRSNYIIFIPHIKLVKNNLSQEDLFRKSIEDIISLVDIYEDFYFIFGDQDKGFEQNIFKALWEAHIINYVLVYHNNKTVYISSHNPFTNISKTTEFGSTSENRFGNILNDLNGFTFKVVMMNDPPRNWYQNGSFYGEDVEHLKVIAFALNASYKLAVFDDYKRIHEKVVNNSVDLVFARRFALSQNTDLVSPLRPSLLEYIVCAVPNSDITPPYQQIFNIFSKPLWLSLLICWFASALLIQLFETVLRGRANFVKSCLTALTIFLSASHIKFRLSGTSTRILLLCWSFFGIIIAASFNSKLGSNLAGRKYYPPIQTIEELALTDLKLGMINGFQAVIFQSVPELSHLEVVPFANIYELGKSMVYSDHNIPKNKMAYIGPKTILERISHMREAYGRNKFLILDRVVIPGYNVYDSSKNSIWARKMEHMLSIVFEGGLASRGVKKLPPAVEERREPRIITHYYFLGPYIIWGVGVVLGVMVFLYELVY